jgi:hypothetical protein
MSNGATSWSENEVRAAVKEYFRVLEAEQKSEYINKREVYRQLSKKFPHRSQKSFELKFQNISAILYELHLPYCKGLKPRGHYQLLLKLFVLDHLKHSPLPPVEPHKILFSKLQELKGHGPIPIFGKGSGRFGLAIEKALGIPANSSKEPDFMGIELKTKSNTRGLQTLFSRTPSRYLPENDKKKFFDQHCHFEIKNNRRALYTSFSTKPDSFGFFLQLDNQVVRVMNQEQAVLEYDVERLEEALISKHAQTAFLSVLPSGAKGSETCELLGATYCKQPSIIRFLRLLETGAVYLDLMMSETSGGQIKDHGFLWRIHWDCLDRLYLHTELLNLDTD